MVTCTFLGDQVKDVTASTRLTESPSCIVTDQNDPSIQMREMMRSMGQGANMPESKPILEINPNHSIVKSISKMRKSKAFDNICQLLLDQALLVDGAKLDNPAEFVGRLDARTLQKIQDHSKQILNHRAERINNISFTAQERKDLREHEQVLQPL